MVAGDAGKAILMQSSSVTVPNYLFAAGDAVTIINGTSGDVTITKSISTMYFAADGTTANRTLATRGIATIYFRTSSEAYISGAGLS